MMNLVLQFSFKLLVFPRQMTCTLKSITRFKKREVRVQMRSWQLTITTYYIQSICKFFTTVENICTQKQVFIFLFLFWCVFCHSGVVGFLVCLCFIFPGYIYSEERSISYLNVTTRPTNLKDSSEFSMKITELLDYSQGLLLAVIFNFSLVHSHCLKKSSKVLHFKN